MRRARTFILLRIPVCLREQLLIYPFYFSTKIAHVGHDGFIAIFHIGVAIDIRRANTVRNPVTIQEIILEVDLWSIICSTVFYGRDRVILITVLVLQCQKTASLTLACLWTPGTARRGGTHFTGMMHSTGIGFKAFFQSKPKNEDHDDKKHQDEQFHLYLACRFCVSQLLRLDFFLRT